MSEDLFLNWSGPQARAAAVMARRLISARSTVPPGMWEGAAAECGIFFEVLANACSRAAQDDEFLWYLVGSLAGHGFLFASLTQYPDIQSLQDALEVARSAQGGEGWLV